MKRLPLAALPILALPLFAADPPAKQPPVSDEARRIHQSALVIDGHNDLPWNLRDRKDRSFLETAQEGTKEWNELMVERGTRKDKPMKPQVVAHELNKLLSDDAIVATDSGTVTTWIARHLTMRGNMMFSCSGNLATMACGLPYAIAAAVAHPGRQVVAFVGDGGLTMLMGELATCVKYGLDVKVVVIKNNSLGQIKWEQMVFLGNPEYVCDLHRFRHCGARLRRARIHG